MDSPTVQGQGAGGIAGDADGSFNKDSLLDESEGDISESEEDLSEEGEEEDMDDEDMDADEGMDGGDEDFVDSEDPFADAENPMDDMEGPDLDPSEVSLGVEDLMGDDIQTSASGLGSMATVAMAANKFKRMVKDGDDVDEQDAVNAATHFDFGSNQASSSGNIFAAAPV
jgi:hypothetical protein